MQDYAVKDESYFSHARTDIEAFLPPFSASVLEVGCGAGATLRWLKGAGKVGATVGVELFEAAGELARGHVDRVLVGNAEALIGTTPELSAPARYDLVLCLDVLEHMVDPWAFVAKLEGLLNPGGWLICSVPNVRHLGVSLPLLLAGRWRYRSEGVLDRTHLRFFAREGALDLMTTPQLRVEKWQHGFPGAHSNSARMNAWTLGLFKDLFALQYLVASRKAGAASP